MAGLCGLKQDFGVRAPWPIRVLSLVCYSESVRRGALLLRAGRDGDVKKDARLGLGIYTFVYGFDSFNAIFLRWIGLQGIHMHHMYEHHLLGFSLGVALCSYVYLHPDSWDVFLLDLCYYPLSVGLTTQLCEIWAILRTFTKEPDSKGKKIVRHALGALLVSSLSGAILLTLCRYLKDFYSGEPSIAEAIIVVLSVFLASIVQPSYVLRHLGALRKLLAKDGRCVSWRHLCKVTSISLGFTIQHPEKH